jgi:hypothetical protein
MAIFNKQNIDINIDLTVLADKLAKDPTFIAAVAKAVRDQLTKDVRTMGNLYGNKAQIQLNNQTKPPTLNTNQTRRLN